MPSYLIGSRTRMSYVLVAEGVNVVTRGRNVIFVVGGLRACGIALPLYLGPISPVTLLLGLRSRVNLTLSLWLLPLDRLPALPTPLLVRFLDRFPALPPLARLLKP